MSLREGLPPAKITSGLLKLKDGKDRLSLIIHAPKNMSFLNNYDEMLGFIYARQWYSFIPGAGAPHKSTTTDLGSVRTISLDAALVLVADYHRSLLSKSGYQPYINDDHWPANIRAVLEMLGFYELVQASGRTSRSQDMVQSPLKFVPFVSGEEVDGQMVDGLIEALKAAAGRTAKRVAIYAALVEAMKNVRNHAYPPDRPEQVAPSIPNWWAAGAYSPSRSELMFAMFDQGVGIPATLPKKAFFEAILQRCPMEFNDADVIAGAIDYGRTSTDMVERGNGLWTICKLVEELPGSQVRLLSGRGQVTYSSRATVKKKLHPNPFCGTLVQWSLILPKDDPTGAPS